MASGLGCSLGSREGVTPGCRHHVISPALPAEGCAYATREQRAASSAAVAAGALRCLRASPSAAGVRPRAVGVRFVQRPCRPARGWMPAWMSCSSPLSRSSPPTRRRAASSTSTRSASRWRLARVLSTGTAKRSQAPIVRPLAARRSRTPVAGDSRPVKDPLAADAGGSGERAVGGVSPSLRGRAGSARRSRASRTSWSRSGPARRLRRPAAETACRHR
jgi:hypothetical protein